MKDLVPGSNMLIDNSLYVVRAVFGEPSPVLLPGRNFHINFLDICIIRSLRVKLPALKVQLAVPQPICISKCVGDFDMTEPLFDLWVR